MADSHTRLYTRLIEVLGDDHADTLMNHLPTASGDEIATRADVADVRSDVAALKVDVAELKTGVADIKTVLVEQSHRSDRLEDRMERFEVRFDEIRRDIQTHTRHFILAALGSSAVVAGGFVGAAALL